MGDETSSFGAFDLSEMRYTIRTMLSVGLRIGEWNRTQDSMREFEQIFAERIVKVNVRSDWNSTCPESLDAEQWKDIKILISFALIALFINEWR